MTPPSRRYALYAGSLAAAAAITSSMCLHDALAAPPPSREAEPARVSVAKSERAIRHGFGLYAEMMGEDVRVGPCRRRGTVSRLCYVRVGTLRYRVTVTPLGRDSWSVAARPAPLR